MTIGRHIHEATKRLTDAGCDSPRLDAELLLGHVLSLNRAQLIARSEELLSPDEERTYQALLDRRAQREPLAYIVGHKEFFGLELETTPHVLVPRPETELLVEQTVRLSHEIAPAANVRIADIGTGSGAIAISLALSLPEAVVYAVDRSTAALAVAARNCQRHGVETRVRLLAGDLLAPLPEPVDIVVANLPYISPAEIPSLMPEVRLFEPQGALDGGDDGLELIRRLLQQVMRQPRRPQAVLLEIGAHQGEMVLQIASEILPEATVSLMRDYAGLERIITVRL